MLDKALAQRSADAGPILMFFIALTIAAVAGQTWWVIAQDKELTLASEKANGLVAVRILEEHATQTLHEAERRIDAVANAIRDASRDGFNDAIAIREVVAQGTQDYPFMKSVQFVNLDGQSWITSRDYPSHQADVTDRTYIRFLLNNPGHDKVVIGHPFQSRYDSQLVVPIGRNIYDGAGRHVGLISVDIRLSYFADVYARVAKDSNATVALFADDGFVIVRSPFEARYVDRDISGYPVLDELRKRPPEGSFEDESLLDDEAPRLYTYRKSSGFPITTAYGRDFDSILSDWRNRTHDRIIFSGAMILFICLLTWFLILYIERLRNSEESLRTSEQRFISIFRHSPVPLALLRMSDNRFVEVNDFWLRDFGYSREEVIGHTSLDFGLWADPDDRQPMIDALQNHGVIDRHETRYKRKDGSIAICLLSGQVIDNKGDQLFIYSATDITRQCEIENEIRKLNTELEERVHNRTQKLEQANAELAEALASMRTMQGELIRSEKMAALGSLVAGVAHELNTPIGNSVTVASTLMEQTEAVLEEERSGKLRRSLFERYLENTTQGTQLLLRTLRRASELISSFKQVAVDQSSDQRRHFDLQNVLQEVSVTLAPTYKLTQYKLELDLAPGLELDSYPGPIGQVVTNFVTNALTHAFEGRSQGTMRLSTRRVDEDHVEIVFSDDGVGIPEANQKRVFDPFFTTKLGQGGSGLGMNIVYNLVTSLLGGAIVLHSKPGEGTTLVVTLPVCAPEPVMQELQEA